MTNMLVKTSPRSAAGFADDWDYWTEEDPVAEGAPPSLAAPKEILVETHRLASDHFRTANIARAVFESVRDYKTSAIDYVALNESGEMVIVQIKEPERPASQPIPEQLRQRLASVFREAASKGNIEQFTASFDKWISSFLESIPGANEESFLDHARRLDTRGQVDAALDIIYDQIDEMLLAGKFEEVDQLLIVVEPSTMSVNLLLGILTVTLPARERLVNRSGFYARVEQTLRDRGEFRPGLLVGLE